jgi:predicted component of type VI protein secretion system
MAELIIQSGKHQGKKLVLSQPQVIIGRSPECHIRLASADISKQHCLLRSTPEGIFVLDLGSRNGTFVNGQVIGHETLLEPGDLLRVGPMEFQVPPGKSTRPAAGAKRTARGVSDDEIAHWLADETRETDVSDDTTTIITAEHNLEPAPAAPAPSPVPAPPPRPEPAKKQFRSVAEEATDIIQRWKSMQEPQT